MNAPAWLAGTVGAACWLSTLPALAAISAQIPPECGSLAELEQALQQRLGSVSAPESTHITLTPEVSGYQLVVEAGNQRRELHDSSCQELLRAAVVITLALLEPKREEAPPPAPARATTPEPSSPVRPNAPTQFGPQFGLGAGGGLHLGTLPKATLLLELDAQLKWTRFGVAAGFRYLLPTSTIDENGRGARIGAVGAYLAGIFEPWHHVQARLGVVAYHLSATGTGLGTFAPRDGSAWELGPTLGASFTPFERPPFWTSLGLEGQLNLIRPSFEILKYNEVFHVPLLSGSALAHAGVVF